MLLKLLLYLKRNPTSRANQRYLPILIIHIYSLMLWFLFLLLPFNNNHLLLEVRVHLFDHLLRFFILMLLVHDSGFLDFFFSQLTLVHIVIENFNWHFASEFLADFEDEPVQVRCDDQDHVNAGCVFENDVVLVFGFEGFSNWGHDVLSGWNSDTHFGSFDGENWLFLHFFDDALGLFLCDVLSAACSSSFDV